MRQVPGALSQARPAGLPRALILAGPTASGKSALALDLAERLGATVINADAMQTYRELRIVTARPSPADESRAPHALYGVRPLAEPSHAAWWREAALAAMAAAHAQGRLPILCGGTGLYLAGLVHGIADIPPPGEAAREEARRLLAERGPVALHAALAEVDPDTAGRLRPTDSQRLARAWEVWRGTGRGLAAWQARPAAPAPWLFRLILLDPPRAELRAAIVQRFGLMLAAGALEEVRPLLGLDPALPGLRAHGVPELLAHLAGRLPLAEARARAETNTQRYTRRQATWFRHQRLVEDAQMHTIHARVASLAQFSSEESRQILAFIQSPG
ncbi:MAG: tRNA (adenosine(37)-N6)-dimethylallyltransferase MiaA [Rhodospirillales bacterium]|nr:tRNA (adenosine(37)-N6)-dimethylallyltransferase MiaA [Rhodospirillales bacterium]